jgi:hypothetical protein
MAERKGNPKWVKGVSGNPNGRPKVPRNVVEMARAASPEAIEALISIMRNKEAMPSARASAANSILDRAWGKPVQMNVNVNTETIDGLTDEELSGYLSALRADVAEEASAIVSAGTGEASARRDH